MVDTHLILFFLLLSVSSLLPCTLTTSFLKQQENKALNNFCYDGKHLQMNKAYESQIGGAAVRLLVFCAGELGSTPRSDYKRVTLVTQNMCGWGYKSLAAYKYSLVGP